MRAEIDIRREPTPMPDLWLTAVRLDPSSREARADARDVCRMHSRIIDATVGMDESGPRALYAQPRPDLLVVRAPEPVTWARLPHGYARDVSSRPWLPPDRAGRYRMTCVVNAAWQNTTGHRTGPDGQKERGCKQAPRPCADDAERAEWLRRRLCAGASNAQGAPDLPDAARVRSLRTVELFTARGRHHGDGRLVVSRLAVLAAEVEVLDPEVVCRSVVGGLGRDKTWGAGLTVWERD